MTIKPTNSPNDAFTLFELLLVMAILALLATGAALTLKGPYQRAQLENATERIELFDRQLRDHARRHGKQTELIINLKNSTLTRKYFDDQQKTNTSQPFHPGKGIKIDQVYYDGRRKEFGQVGISYTAQGQTPTVAMRLSNAAGQKRWLVFVGLSGQILHIDGENGIDNLREILSVERAYTH